MTGILFSIVSGVCFALCTDDDRSQLFRCLTLSIGVTFAVWAFR